MAQINGYAEIEDRIRGIVKTYNDFNKLQIIIKFIGITTNGILQVSISFGYSEKRYTFQKKIGAHEYPLWDEFRYFINTSYDKFKGFRLDVSCPNNR